MKYNDEEEVGLKKKDLMEQFSKKTLVIRGTGKLAKEFYDTYGRMLKISYCTSNRQGECIDGIPRIELEEMLKKKEDYFIIVCVGDYEAVSFEYISEGFMPGKDFFPAKIVAGLVDQKKVFLAVGQCELAVTDYIFQHTSLTGRYVFLYYDEYKVLGIAEQKPLLQWVLEVNAVIEIADYFICPVNLTFRDKYYNRLLSKVNAECCTVRVPISTFEGYWPQDGAINYYEKSPYYLSLYSMRFRRDVNIEKAFESGKEADILQNIAKEDFYEEEVIRKGFEKTLKKFEIMERKTDVKISDYYRTNYMYKRLFLDRGHAAICVLKEYAKRILESCEIIYDLWEIEAMDLSWYDDCHMEFPLYPSVRRVLNLNDNGKYRIIEAGKTDYLDFKEYSELIYHYVKMGMEYLGGRNI